MIGKNIHDFARELWPLNRSLTGFGVRETLRCVGEHLDNFNVHSIKSGKKVFDWEIPPEWSVSEAYIIGPDGQKFCDFSINNLHLVGYSEAFSGTLTLNELKGHLYTLPDQPNAIPYITSYYESRWGFCIDYLSYVLLQEGNYKVHIDAKKFDGVLNYGELLIPGQSSKEIFLSTYVCHPSMANNELSGPAVLTYIAKWLQESPNLKYSYRIVFLPETIGSIAYLSKNFNEMKKNVVSGFNVSCVGDERSYSYVPSRKGNTISDQIAKHVLRWTDPEYKEYGWLDRGSDERQYCAPGIDLPIASILRTKYGEYPEYHTSLDDLENVVTPEGLEGGYEAIKKAIMALERNSYYRVATLGEPLMSKRGLRSTLGTKNNAQDNRMIMGFISYCDGETSLLEIAEMLSVPIWDLYDITEQLVEHEIILEVCN